MPPATRRVGPTILAALALLPSARAEGPPAAIADAFRPPAEFRDDLGPYRSPLIFDDGRPVRTPEDWRDRRVEILRAWRSELGTPPEPAEPPRIEVIETTREGEVDISKVRLRVAPDRVAEGYLLVPEGSGRRPAVVVVFYEPETAIGRGKPDRDFAIRLARKGIVALSIGFDPRVIDPGTNGVPLQPLGYLAMVASNAREALAARPEVDPARIGIAGHSYGGKWAMFAACLDEDFACGAWSDPGVAFDEARPNVNYWEAWYLGWVPGPNRKPGLPTEANPRTGAYARLVAAGRDLHELQALMAPRPFLVSGGAEDGPERWRALNHVVAVNRLLGAEDRVAMTNREGHDPTPESNAQLEAFFVHALRPGPGDGPGR